LLPIWFGSANSVAHDQDFRFQIFV
jgi:hypothetical protein